MTSRRALSLTMLLLLPGVLLTAERSAGDDAPQEVNAGVTRFVRFQRPDSASPPGVPPGLKATENIAYGIVEGDRVRELSGDLFGKWKKTETTYVLKDVTLLVPTQPSKVIALAGNYKDHLGDTPAPKIPEPFFKLPSCLQRHDGPIVLPGDASEVHYEAEMVVVIGKRARNVPPEKALDYVLGITCGNDISAREWQKNDVQWWRAKASDTFGPCGPVIASGLDYNNLKMELRVGGETKQSTNTKNQIHDVPTAVSFISRYVTLEPGDLIFTGTPGKTKPLKPGDVVEVEIEGVGVLRNRVQSEAGSGTPPPSTVKPKNTSNNKGKIEGTKWSSVAVKVMGKTLPAGALRLNFSRDGKVAYNIHTVGGEVIRYKGTYELNTGDYVTLKFDRKLGGLKTHKQRIVIKEGQLKMIDTDGTSVTFTKVKDE